MKLYVHLEDHVSAPPRLWTKRISLTGALRTLDDVLRVVCLAHARAFPNRNGDKSSLLLTPADLQVFTDRDQDSATRKRFEDDRCAHKWFASRATGERCDADGGGGECDFELVVVRKPVGYDTQSDQAKPARTREDASLQSPSQVQQQHLKAGVGLGIRYMQQRKFRSAKQLFETLVLTSDPENAQALVAMGDIHFANQRFDVAVDDWYRKCWNSHSGRPSPDKEQAALVLECGLKIVSCEIERKKYRKALSMIDQLQHLLRHEVKAPKHAVVTPSFSLITAAEKEKMEAQMDLLKAQALYEMHAASPELQEPAIALLVHLLPNLQSPHVNLDALLLYAKIAFERGKKSEALTMVLRVLVARPEDKLVKKQLASFLTDSSEMQLLRQVLPPEGGASAAAAYAFIGTILKDFGALESSVTCFERAQIGNPACPSYALNHAHVLEVCDRYENAYSVLTSFFRKNPTLSVHGVLAADGILKALDGDGWLSSSDQGLEDLHEEKQAANKRDEWRVEWVLEATGHARVFLNDTLVAVPTGDQKPQIPEQDQLDLLACFFTVVKILFLTGKLSEIPRLIGLIEPVRVGRELHKTAIRNEQAYYSCIAQLLSVPDHFGISTIFGRQSQPSEATATTNVYVCGDSHTLATAWREIQVQGQPTPLRPALVTGLKHWHLRKESAFYPKLHFWRVLSSIPSRARVVFLFGEIDCREGILLAVEKCKYESIEEGMEATIHIFMEALSEAVREFEFEAFIHPVVPVLNETRQLVVQYNRIFKKHVLRSRICTWLDFFDDLVYDSPEKLRPEFALDGTHVHPRYLSSLERALNENIN